MSNFIYYHNKTKKLPSKSTITEGINLSGKFLVDVIEEGQSIFGCSRLPSAPLKGERMYCDDNWVIMFSGDLIDYETVPFSLLIEIVRKNDWKKLENLNGIFGIFIFDKINNCCYIISDRRSQHPIYYSIEKDELIFSTELSLFVKLLKEPGFNINWLYDYLYFFYSAGETTFLKNVFKMPAASILKYDLTENNYNIFEYAPLFEIRNPLLEGREALEYASDIFAKQLPKYYPESANIACALTSGWDGRTVLSLAPDHSKVTAYTYGGPGCEDIQGAKKTTKALNIRHKEINFDEDYLKNLSNELYETIYLSAGSQGILRSTLLHVYKTLSEKYNFNLALSGILLDGLFRGNGGYPGVISDEQCNLLKNGDLNFSNIWKEIFDKDYINFEEEIRSKLIQFKNDYGEFTSTKYHLNYEVYQIGFGYFGGEIKLANNFVTIRVPAWDNEITKIAYSIKEGKLTYSQFCSPYFGKKETMVVQAYVMNKLSPKFAKVPFKLTKPNVVLKSDAAYNIYSFYRKVFNKINKILDPQKTTYLEDWEYWINNNLKTQIDELLFSKDSLIQNYISPKYLLRLSEERQYKWIGKLATVEIILRLIQSRWERFW